jgi:DNA-directed RNA polymerase specialized sigma24 family protein
MPDLITDNVVLLLGASPADRVPLALGAEFEAVQRSIRIGSLRDRFSVRVNQTTRADELLPTLLEAQPTVVHFSGHGTTAEGLIFEDANGASRPLDTELLEKVFAEMRTVRCVVLNACYSVEQANAIAKHVGAVIGMDAAVSDAVATGFSTVFYQAVAEGHTLRSAFDLGLVQVDVVDPGAVTIPTWCGPSEGGELVLAAQPQHRGAIARQLYETEYLSLARSISSLLDDLTAGSVVEEVFGEFVVIAPPVEAGRELAWIKGRVLSVAGERLGPPVKTGEDRIDRVLEAIRMLPSPQSKMLLLRYYHGHTDEEIAEITAMTAAAVTDAIEAALGLVAARLRSHAA